MMLDQPMLLKQQLSAIVRAHQVHGNARILIPMISDVEQIIVIRQMLDEILASYEEMDAPMLGMMVEVPAVIYQMKTYAQYVDFFSVGSNDLLQYLVAVDRNNPQVSRWYQPHHPAFNVLNQAE